MNESSCVAAVCIIFQQADSNEDGAKLASVYQLKEERLEIATVTMLYLCDLSNIYALLCAHLDVRDLLLQRQSHSL